VRHFLTVAIAATLWLGQALAQQLSTLPDWSGVWHTKGSPALISVENGRSFVRGMRDHPPYNAEWETKYTENLARAEHQGDPNFPNPLVDTHTQYCAAGMPRLIATPFDYEFIVTPAKTWILVDKESRHIYTDGRKFPPEDQLWGTMEGFSIGHWEGKTLVVETISVKPGLWADTTPLVFSADAHYLERYTGIDANTIENRVTITDPVSLTKPWTFTRFYTRMKPGTWVAEPETCGGPEDRNPIVNGRITTVLPKGK
jgi:hypothetical protein